MSYDFDRDDERINGYAAERLLLSAIQFSKKIYTVEFDGKVLADAIESDPIGVKHLDIADPFLFKEFGRQSTNEYGQKVSVLPSLDVLPTFAILDYVLGIDSCVNYLGYQVGIDVTVNPSSIDKKLRKKRELMNVYSIFKFDKVIIIEVQNKFDAQQLELTLKQIIKSKSQFLHVVTI
jgi:hypothetical protein